ncbi:hypothetical protein [Serratia fonticola]
MARKTMSYTVKEDGRDKGKTFVLTEMPAAKAEKWAMRALLAMIRDGIDIPDNVMDSGMAGIGRLGLQMIGKLPYAEAEALLDEMFSCITIAPNPSSLEITRSLVEDDIEEISTRVKLRMAVFNLHVDFSTAAGQLTTVSASPASSPAA